MDSTKRTSSRLSPAATPTTRSPRLRRTVSGTTTGSSSSSLLPDRRPITPSRPSSTSGAISRSTRSATTSPRPSIDRRPSSSSSTIVKARHSISSSTPISNINTARVDNITSSARVFINNTKQEATGNKSTTTTTTTTLITSTKKILTTSSSLRKLASTVTGGNSDDYEGENTPDKTAVAKFLRRSSPHNLALKRAKSFAINGGIGSGTSSPSSSNSPMSPSRPLLPPYSPLNSRSSSPSQRDSSPRMKTVLRYFNKSTLMKQTPPPSPEEEEGFHQYKMMSNRLLQLRFANAKAEGAMISVKKKAEVKLFHVWLRLYKLRYSIAEKRARVERLRLKIKLIDIVFPQVEMLEVWERIEKRNVEGVGRVARKLAAYSTKLPLVDGAEADVVDFYDAMSLSIEVMEDIEETIIKFFSKANKMCKVLRQLIATMEENKESLQELEKAISAIMALETVEQSLQAHMLQANKELGNQSSLSTYNFDDMYIFFRSNKVINPLYYIPNTP